MQDKPSFVLINKTDLFPEGLMPKVVAFFKKKKIKVLPISAATGEGIDQLDILLSEFA
jgi:ribosome biogenesis GTPase A